MWKRLLSGVWQRMPKRARRWSVLLANARFTVTVGAVILDEQRRVLLLDHRFRPRNSWGIPGGFINPYEQPEDALRRELREEIGLEVENLELAFIHSLAALRQVEIIFRATPCNTAQPCSMEILQAQWFALDALPASLIKYQHWLIRRALQDL